ncbi:MAG TPA: hypothetical protein VGK38_08835 [Prolixibacteraceae bacterium]
MKSAKKDEVVTVSKKIGASTAVWFAASRSFVLFENPAWEVFDKYMHNLTVAEIVDFLNLSYDLSEEEILQFVNDIIAWVDQLNDPVNETYHSPELRAEFDDFAFPLFSEKYYQIGNEFVCFRYGSEWLMNCFHPTMSHLNTNSEIGKHLFEVFEIGDLLIFRYNGKSVEAFDFKNSHFLRGAVSQKLFGVIYGVADQDWMVTLHSAAVSDGQSAIIFPAQAGSGKSTLSALLQAHGFTVLSDDFNAINSKNGFVYRLPLSISVKEGSLKTLELFYPELNEISPEKAATGKIVRHLPVANNIPGSQTAFPVKAFVFVKYSEAEPFVFEEVEKREAIQALLPETWVNPDPENVARFFDWFDEISFYRLQYSDYQEAIDAIELRFKK